MGLWHGASWTFVLWGLYHAVIVYVHRRFRASAQALPPLLRSVGGVAVTMPIAMLSWIPFQADSVGDALSMWAKVVDPRQYGGIGLRENHYLVAALLLLMMLAAYAVREQVMPWLEGRPVPRAVARVAAYSVGIALVVVFLRPIQQFIYFQF